MKKYRLTIHPDIDNYQALCKQFLYDTKEEMFAASRAVATMFLFIQDDLCIMPDRANLFFNDELIDGEWETIDE